MTFSCPDEGRVNKEKAMMDRYVNFLASAGN
jgi:hypothetical protein